jgi:hypothetical protein
MNLLDPHGGKSLGRLKQEWNKLCAREITRLLKILTLSEIGKILKMFKFFYNITCPYLAELSRDLGLLSRKGYGFEYRIGH